MSVAVNSSRYSTAPRRAHAPRQVVVPDRTIKRTKEVSPIINLQTVSAPVQPVLSQMASSDSRRRPIASSKVHASMQKVEAKKTKRPAVRQVAQPVAKEIESLLERQKDIPRHLARTAGRAHLLSEALNLETPKVRWYQRLRSRLVVE